WLLADAAQSFGAADPAGRRVGSLCAVTTTSFDPAKPLGCYGDGGAVFTLDPELAAILRSLRLHGTEGGPYHHVRVGSNSRLDTLQAAILLEKLKIFPEEIERRNAVALRYSAALADVAAIPVVPEGAVSTWAQYTIRVDAQKRADLAADLNASGIPTAIHYPCPLHRQPAFAAYPVAGNGLPVSERLAGEVISLPMHPYLDAGTQERIVAAVRALLKAPDRQPVRTSA
ncbi:MAG: DegT/DnrJ/EryC1/StrS family aminotransferase, partial [Variibacter sp.]|nr:DegT/DnrJ/EryC1/StrS family aminotransferase [Variibacter sp.]